MLDKKKLLIIFLAILLTSCFYVKNLLNPPQDAPKKFVKSYPKVIAILPFDNFTDHSEASDILRKVFYAQFSPKNFIDIEMLTIDSELKKNHINHPSQIKQFDITPIGKMLNADALICATVTRYKKGFRFFYAFKTIGLSARMIETRTGKTLWAAEHEVTSYGGGIPGAPSFDPINILLSLTGPVKALWDYYFRETEFIKNANELCRELVETIPEPLPT